MFKILKFREPRGLFEKVLISSNSLIPILKITNYPLLSKTSCLNPVKFGILLLRTFLKKIRSILIEVISSLEKRQTLTTQLQ